MKQNKSVMPPGEFPTSPLKETVNFVNISLTIFIFKRQNEVNSVHYLKIYIFML